MNNSEIILYTTPQGDVKLEVIVRDVTVWLTQKAMGELFGVTKSTISEHLTNIYQNSELEKAATVRKIRTVQIEGDREVSHKMDYYNLDMIIALGYRINSKNATQFRQWATLRLKE